MKIIGYVGEPAVGKSTIMRNHIENFTSEGDGELIKEGVVVYHKYPQSKSIVMGIYDEGVFSGTDRLSKSVGPVFRAWLSEKQADAEYKDWTLYWEGERFSNSPNLDHMYSTCPSTTVHLVTAPDEILAKRHASRDNQDEKWLKGMKTRVGNLAKKYPLVKLA